MHINKTDHPELWEAKIRRFKRRVDQLVAESRAAHHLQDIKTGQVTIQNQQTPDQSGLSSQDKQDLDK